MFFSLIAAHWQWRLFASKLCAFKHVEFFAILSVHNDIFPQCTFDGQLLESQFSKWNTVWAEMLYFSANWWKFGIGDWVVTWNEKKALVNHPHRWSAHLCCNSNDIVLIWRIVKQYCSLLLILLWILWHFRRKTLLSWNESIESV